MASLAETFGLTFAVDIMHVDGADPSRIEEYVQVLKDQGLIVRGEQVQIDGTVISGDRYDTSCIEDFYIVLRDYVSRATTVTRRRS